MNFEKERERHDKIIASINEANDKSELPKVTLSTLLKYFSDNAYFEDKKLSSSLFEPVYETILETGFFISPKVKEIFINILKENYPDYSDSEYEEKYKNINPVRVNYIIEEMYKREERVEEFTKKEFLDKHNSIMKDIASAYEIKDVPTVTKGTLNSFICSNSRILPNSLKAEDISSISDLLIDGESLNSEKIRDMLYDVCKTKNPFDIDPLFAEFYQRLSFGDRVNYIVEEVNARNNRITEIYKENHEETMENIKNAKRISQLPPNLTVSTLAGYFSGNTTIYPKAEQISSTKFGNISNLFLQGKTFEDEEIKNELKQIASEAYPETSEEAYLLLYNKLSVLPRTNYLVEEINYSNERQTEFIGRSASNVNVYLVPNPKSPMDGGRFYNCYINRVDNLDLEEILPLDLEKIIPEDMDVDAIEWYVQEYYDDTFKTAGGIILNRDETIGNVNVFKPSDGKIGVTPEEHSKYKELEELSRQVKTIINRKQEETAAFTKLQQEFFKRQQETDLELARLEEKIDLLTQNNNKKGAK